MKNYTFYSNSVLRFKIILIFSVFYMLIFLTACPKLPKANIKITLDSSPVLMKWNGNAGLWYMDTSVTITETEGVGVSVAYIKVEFIYEIFYTIGGFSESHLVALEGGKVDAFESVTCAIEVGTSSRGWKKVIISISGMDNNGYDIKAQTEANLDYVD